MKTFEIFFSDLNEDSKKELCREFDTSEEEENWEVSPLCVIYKEEHNK
jgi:hypothetical protein